MTETSPAPKRPADSVTTMTEYVLPTHANVLGNVFGGQVLAWIDLCAAICAQRHTRRTAITAGIDELSFERPIKVGQVVHISARVTAAFDHTGVVETDLHERPLPAPVALDGDRLALRPFRIATLRFARP